MRQDLNFLACHCKTNALIKDQRSRPAASPRITSRSEGIRIPLTCEIPGRRSAKRGWRSKVRGAFFGSEYSDRHITRNRPANSSVIFVSVQSLLNDIHMAGLACYTDRHSSMIRKLKKSLFSSAQPWRLFHPPALSLPRQPPHPGTRLFPCGVLASLRGSTLRRSSSEVGSTVGGFSVRQDPCKWRTVRTKCGLYLLASSLAAALLNGPFEYPAGHSNGSWNLFLFMRASRESGGRALLQCSQVGLSSSRASSM